MRRLSAVLLAAVLTGCASQVGPATNAWCGQHLIDVAAAGTAQGTAFAFPGRDPVTWPEYLADSPAEQAIVAAEATDGSVTWARACQQAYVQAHPGTSPEPTATP